MLKKIIPVLSSLTKSSIAYFFILTCLGLPLTKAGKAGDAFLLDKVIATVNQELILHSDLEEACNQLALEGEVVDESVKMYMLRALVLNKIFIAKAMLHGIKIPKPYINDINKKCHLQMAKLIESAGSEEKLVQGTHQSIYHIKKNIKQRLKEEYLAFLVHQNLTQHVVVTPGEVQAYFNALPPHDRPYYPSSVEVHQLVVYPKVGTERQEVVKNKLLDLKQLLLHGTVTFSELAKQHSDDLHSAAKGGEIGWVPLGILAPAYEKAALALKIGEISDPIASEFGFHLIELMGRNKDQYNTRHILQVVEPTEEESKLTGIELNKIRAKITSGILTFAAAVQQYSEDQETVAQGGVITAPQQGGDRLPGVLIPVEALNPDLYFAIDGLEPGAVSAPQYLARIFLKDMDKSYRSAWRLFYLKQKVAAHPMNLTQDYEKIHYDLLQQKKKEAVNKWLQTVKSEFVISFSQEYRAVEQLLG